MNTCVTTHLFMLTVSWLDLRACTSWSKEQYFITHISQAAYTIRSQLSSLSCIKDALQEQWRPPGKTDVEWERALTVPVNTCEASEHLQDRSAFCQPKTNLCEHDSVEQGNDRYKLRPVPLALRVRRSIPKYTLNMGFMKDSWHRRSFFDVGPVPIYYTKLSS